MKKYLFVDDQPNYLKRHRDTLREAGYEVEMARDLGAAWERIEQERETGNPFDLVLIDLALDRKVPEFKKEDEELRDALLSQGHGDVPISGQALGLRLWRLRRELQQRYCYVTNYSALWVESLDKQNPEFGAKALEKLENILLLDKRQLWLENVEEKFQRAYQMWEDERWLR
ncbi:MAG: Response regulator receiver domain-containing protein [Candidatus Kentron sp. G]|nr:MAG: Response regulator receiver domain-containing protein [Candidatus Kentron sp. G]VFM97466.1 MAG: Response regulator receiver domain-containing protein [Candidatus Kentron sp. G]VFM99891.1 MAG: Response regulator receiver domain-containing protein [Candidatus Kentron sp. G]